MKRKIEVPMLEGVVRENLQPFDGKSCTIMISGGSILRVLAAACTGQMDGSQWAVYFADERMVPHTDPESNYLQAAPFIQDLGTAHPVDTSLPEPEMLEDYKTKLQNAKFDIAFLGIGEDGHIASIFPGSPVIDSSDILAIVKNSPKPPAVRVTVTPRMLTMIPRIVFLIPALPNGLPKPVDEPHFSIMPKLNTDVLIAKECPLSEESGK